ADLELDLVAVRVLAHPATRGDGLVAHGQGLEPGRCRGELRIGMAVRGDRLPVRGALIRLNDDPPPSDRLDVSHDCLRAGVIPQTPPAPPCRPVIRRTVWSDMDTENLSSRAWLPPKLALPLWTFVSQALAFPVQKSAAC